VGEQRVAAVKIMWRKREIGEMGDFLRVEMGIQGFGNRRPKVKSALKNLRRKTRDISG